MLLFLNGVLLEVPAAGGQEEFCLFFQNNRRIDEGKNFTVGRANKDHVSVPCRMTPETKKTDCTTDSLTEPDFIEMFHHFNSSWLCSSNPPEGKLSGFNAS